MEPFLFGHLLAALSLVSIGLYGVHRMQRHGDGLRSQGQAATHEAAEQAAVFQAVQAEAEEQNADRLGGALGAK